jgi:hypothetical protein
MTVPARRSSAISGTTRCARPRYVVGSWNLLPIICFLSTPTSAHLPPPPSPTPDPQTPRAVLGESGVGEVGWRREDGAGGGLGG